VVRKILSRPEEWTAWEVRALRRSTVRLNMWWAEDSQRIEINCSDMPTALAFIERARQTELAELDSRYWQQCPISDEDLEAQRRNS
jgi:hypothetical protein